MYRYTKAVIIVGLMALALAVACSDRGTNVPTRDDTTGWTLVPKENPVFVSNSENPSPQLMFQRGNAEGMLPMAVYVPKIAFPPASVDVPTLLLLAPQEGNQFYYFQHGLVKLLNEMIASGEIVPMIVACVGNDDKFGGYFYGNSYPGGFYDEVIGKELMKVMEFRYPMALEGPKYHAISGMGQGAYGALRAAIQHPGVFGSVSVVDGPLDFDGENGQGGFINLFRPALDEQIPNGFFGASVDTSKSKEITRMFIGGSLAFSPHDTLIEFTGQRARDLNILARYQVTDNATMVTSILPGRTDGPIRSSENIQFAFHLPFNSNANADLPTWQRWIDNNLETLYNKQGDPLANTGVWIATSPQANRLTYHEQTVAFQKFLESKNIEPTVYPYSGYIGNPATDGQYTYYLLREILKFHSAQFTKN